MKKLISLLVVMGLLICAVPVIAVATEEEAQTAPITKLYVGSVNALETPQGEGWSFNAETGVLTLNNCTLTEAVLHTITYDYGDGEIYYDRYNSVIYFTGDLTIELIGNNSVERTVEVAPSETTNYYAICAGSYQKEVDGEIWYLPSKLAIRGGGNLTAGVTLSRDCLDADGYDNWEYLGFSCGIGCSIEGGVDLTGLHSGGWVDIYGGVRDYDAYYNVRAFNNAPTFGSNAIVTAYQDLDGTFENEFGYNWNNNDAWRMKVVTADAHLNSKGLLTLLDSGTASGNGWTWENNVLTLSSDTEVKAIEFCSGLGSAKLVLAGDVTLDSTDMGYDANWNQRGAINAYCDLELDLGDHTLTLEGTSCPVVSYLGDVTIRNGSLEYAPEWGDNITMNGGALTIKNATISSVVGIVIYSGQDENWETVPGGALTVENSVLDLGAPIVNYENVLTIKNSQVTVDGDYQGINGIGGLVLEDSQITVDATSDTAVALQSYAFVTIDNCDLNITSANIAISAGNFYGDMETDRSVLNLSNMTILQPEGYRMDVAEDWSGARFMTVYKSQDEVSDVLITSGSKAGCAHSYENGICTQCGVLESYNWTLTADADVDLTLEEDLYVDLAGYDLSGTITTNGYKVYGMDTSTNEYTCDNMGYFSCVDENGDAIVPENGDHYLTIAIDNGYTFHKYSMGITNLSLAPTVTGFGYKAEFYGDQMVQSKIASIGYSLWLDGGKTVSRTTAFQNKLTLRLKNFDVANYGQTPVNANVTITLTDGTVIESSTVSYSLRQMVEIVNEQYTALNQSQLSAIQTMIANNPTMQSWQVENLYQET